MYIVRQLFFQNYPSYVLYAIHDLFKDSRFWLLEYKKKWLEYFVESDQLLVLQRSTCKMDTGMRIDSVMFKSSCFQFFNVFALQLATSTKKSPDPVLQKLSFGNLYRTGSILFFILKNFRRFQRLASYFLFWSFFYDSWCKLFSRI